MKNKKFIYIVVSLFILGIISIIAGIKNSNFDFISGHLSPSSSSQPINLDNINFSNASSIDISVLDADVDIIVGDKWDIEYELSDDEGQIFCSVKDSTLEFYTENAVGSHGSNISIGGKDSYYVTITVPRHSLSELEISNVAGNISFGSIDCYEVEINSVSGNIKAKNISANNIDFNTVSGDIQLLSSKGQLVKCNSVSGNAELEGKFDKWDINTVSGKQIITAFTPLNIKAQTMGGINHNGQKVESPFVFKSDSPTLVAKSVSGRITIK